MNSEAKTIAGGLGCLSFVFWLIVCVPLWFVMLYGILVACNAPTWLWVVYWIYCPVNFFSTLVLKLIAEFLSAD